jgi:thiamine biosynthesis protein ThiI
MMRRGAVLIGVHFSGRPQTNDASERLVVQIGDVLERTGGLGRIYLVPFGDLQREISLLVPPDLRVLLYRRLMIRVAEQIAATENAKALVTGESLGQVASQTLDNIRAVDEAATLPVLRPLVGSDKIEIIADARRIGTYELSTQEHVDCCTLFMPRTPETHARLRPVLDAEANLDTERMVADALASMTWQDYRSPSYRPPKRWPTPVDPSATPRPAAGS